MLRKDGAKPTTARNPSGVLLAGLGIAAALPYPAPSLRSIGFSCMMRELWEDAYNSSCLFGSAYSSPVLAEYDSIHLLIFKTGSEPPLNESLSLNPNIPKSRTSTEEVTPLLDDKMQTLEQLRNRVHGRLAT